MKKLMVLLTLSVFMSGQVFAFDDLISYSSATSVKRSLTNLEYQIRDNNRKIRKIQSSDRISEYDKKRKIRELEKENYTLKRKISKLKSDYRKAIS